MPFEPQTFQRATTVPQTFSELLKLYQDKQADAAIDLSVETDVRTRPGMEMRKNGAIQALPGLKMELFRMLEQHAGAVFLTGTKAGIESFVGLAMDQTEGNVVVVSAQEMYDGLGKMTNRGIRHDRRFSMDTMNAFVDGIMKLLNELNVDGIPAPNLTSYLNQVFETEADVANLVKKALQGLPAQSGIAVGDGLNAIYLQQRAAEEAIKEGVATDFLPVIVTDATPEEATGGLGKTIFFGRNVVFECKKDETPANAVTLVFKSLMEQKRRGSKA